MDTQSPTLLLFRFKTPRQQKLAELGLVISGQRLCQNPDIAQQNPVFTML